MPSPLIITKTQFHFLQQGFSLSKRTELKTFIELLFKKEKKRLAEIRYIFCSDDYLLQINKSFLKHDFYTDIITFDLSESGDPINAEIYISVDRVRDNSIQFNTSLKREIHRVIFHGALHLCGYRDKTKNEQLIMRQMEDRYLSLYLK